MAVSQYQTAARVVVVDPQLDDYRCLIEPARKRLLRMSLTCSGSNALRLAPSFTDAVWLINTKLPDMPGFDLLEMLHSLKSGLRIAVVDDQYDPQRERQALQRKALQYVCKPVRMDWFWAWQGKEPPIVGSIEHQRFMSHSPTTEQTQ